MSEPLVQPEPPDPRVEETRGFWRDVGRTMVRDSFKTIDETARQIIGVAGILEGLYFHAIAYSGLRGQVSGGQVVLYAAPLGLLMLSLLAAVLVHVPDRYHVNVRSSEACQQVYEHVVTVKLRLLRAASLFLVLGVGAVAVAVVVYLRG
jgi:hypothetical protein